MSFYIEVTRARFVCDECGDSVELSGPDANNMALAAGLEHTRVKHSRQA